MKDTWICDGCARRYIADTGAINVTVEEAELRSQLREMTARALGHAYTAGMAEDGEDIQSQELDREREDHAASRAKVRRLEGVLAGIVRSTSDEFTRAEAREALNVDD